MIANVDIYLLFSIVGWAGIGLTIGRLIHAALVRRRQRPERIDLPLTLILGLVGATIGGAVGWSMHGPLTAPLASLVGALLGALLLSIVFQFIMPV